jgi:hypothetical protein
MRRNVESVWTDRKKGEKERGKRREKKKERRRRDKLKQSR